MSQNRSTFPLIVKFTNSGLRFSFILFLFLFSFQFISSFFYFQNIGLELVTITSHKMQKRKKKVLEQMTSYYMDCYSTRVWTDFRVRVSGQEQDSSILLVYNGHRVRRQAHDLEVMWNSLERSGRTQGLEGSGRVQMELGLGDDVKRHGFLMVYTECAHVQWRLKV